MAEGNGVTGREFAELQTTVRYTREQLDKLGNAMREQNQAVLGKIEAMHAEIRSTHADCATKSDHEAISGRVSSLEATRSKFRLGGAIVGGVALVLAFFGAHNLKGAWLALWS